VRARAARAGFTLIEVLAVVALTVVVLGVALAFYVNLSRASAHATEQVRDVRRATAILDRVARDLESSVLVKKPEETDPLDHPWLFFGEARGGGDAANRLKFVRRGHEPRRSASHEADLEVVSYAVRRADDDTLELLRSSTTQLPESQDREIPTDEADGAQLLADGLAGFGVTFLDELGERSASWDSASVVQADELPAAVEIEVAFADADDPEAEPTSWRRRVLLPVRPLDLEELLDPSSAVGGGGGSEADEADEDEDDEDGEDDDGGDQACAEGPCAGLSVCQAVNCSQDYGPSVNGLLEEIGGQSFCHWRARIPASMSWIILNPACQ
jgi:prepilin-type N-terminal cleavage/methylation domain-containing protein